MRQTLPRTRQRLAPVPFRALTLVADDSGTLFVRIDKKLMEPSERSLDALPQPGAGQRDDIVIDVTIVALQLGRLRLDICGRLPVELLAGVA